MVLGQLSQRLQVVLQHIQSLKSVENLTLESRGLCLSCVLSFLSSSCSADWTPWCRRCSLQSRTDELHTDVINGQHRRVEKMMQVLPSTPGWVSSSWAERLFLLPTLFLYDFGLLLVWECCQLSAGGSVLKNRASEPEGIPATAAGQNQGCSGSLWQGRNWWWLRPEAQWWSWSGVEEKCGPCEESWRWWGFLGCITQEGWMCREWKEPSQLGREGKGGSGEQLLLSPGLCSCLWRRAFVY